MDTHTPGPWWYQEKSDDYTHIVRAGENRFVCQLAQGTDGSDEADARLIATAPELLSELRHVLSAYVLPERKTCGEAAYDGDRIKALIAKATGGASE